VVCEVHHPHQSFVSVDRDAAPQSLTGHTANVSDKPIKNHTDIRRFVNFVVMNRNELTYRVKEIVKALDPKAKVILFGSKARGDSYGSSDWDFLILTSINSNEQNKKVIRDKLIDTELEAGEVISTIIFSQKKWSDYTITPLYKNIIKDGIEL
jgi:uncharacterized protein